jgi:hypothetical protein
MERPHALQTHVWADDYIKILSSCPPPATCPQPTRSLRSEILACHGSGANGWLPRSGPSSRLTAGSNRVLRWWWRWPS